MTCSQCAKVALYRSYQDGAEIGFCRTHYAAAVAAAKQATAKLVGRLVADREARIESAGRRAWKARGMDTAEHRRRKGRG